VPIDGGKTRCRADRLTENLPATAWTRRSAGDGSKGPRFYDWAWLTDVGADGDPDDDGRHSLLIRRNHTTGELAFYRCWRRARSLSPSWCGWREFVGPWRRVCAPRGALSHPQRSWEELGRRFLGLNGLPAAERWAGTRACQKTSGRAQTSGAVRWETRVIWRKLNCLKPNLQSMQLPIHRKDV
jgi:hypothetical protein